MSDTQNISSPLVSVLMITYNHEKFISAAIESVLSQVTDFPFELVIGEDCSTDATREIITAYSADNPGRIRTVFPAENQGAARCLLRTLRACRGRYVALLDGDDYWTSSEKLRKQTDILESHPEFSICCHRTSVVYEDGGREPWEYPVWERQVLTIEDLLRENFIPTCSAMFRQGLLLDIPFWYPELGFGDWALHLMVAQFGDIALIPETMSVYRVHGAGSWSRLGQHGIAKSKVQMFQMLYGYLPSRYRPLIREMEEQSARELNEAAAPF
jgi:glycosyltransferase involved in cell wall biosynthesis